MEEEEKVAIKLSDYNKLLKKSFLLDEIINYAKRAEEIKNKDK